MNLLVLERKPVRPGLPEVLLSHRSSTDRLARLLHGGANQKRRLTR
jgi:hypothetical protein